ncbi:MAG: hypothetical protein H7Y17_15090 [Chlorobia bacterium]|nr:hypothetical protein [Fimbriimonadaceae bacterium]
MRGRIVRTVAKWVFYLAIAGTVAGMYVMANPEAFTPIPSTRDEALVGDWYVQRYGSFRHYVFRSDGTGEIWNPGRETRKFRWGTQDRRLRMKYQTGNGWTAPEFDMQVDSESDEVELKPRGSGPYMVLQREAPESAVLK